MESSPLHLLFLLGYCLALIEGELRCHCNESGCVATGYMCKSRAGQCFTAVEVRGEVRHFTHGCVDSLSDQRRALCQQLADPTSSASASATRPGAVSPVTAGGDGATPGKASPNAEGSHHQAAASAPSSSTEAGSSSSDVDTSGGTSSSRSNLSAGVHHHRQMQQRQQQEQVQNPSEWDLLCCTEHMCNYGDDTDMSVNLVPKTNSSYRGGGSQAEERPLYTHDHRPSRRRDEDADSDLWFKAAVIAVPIAGGFILVLLVLLAVRMLRSDSTRHRRLIQIRRERSLTKAHMYISEHFMGGTAGAEGKLQHCSLFDEKKLRPPRGSYSVHSEKISPSSVYSTRGNNSSGSGGPAGEYGDNKNNLFTNSNSNKAGSSSSGGGGGGGHNSRGGFTPAVCCTDELPCCGGLCSVQRETQIIQCETCKSKRLSRSNYNSTYSCCNKMCHSNLSGCTVSPKSSISDIKTSIWPCSKSDSAQSTPPHSPTGDTPGAAHLKSSSHVHHTPRSFSTDSPPNSRESSDTKLSQQLGSTFSKNDDPVRNAHSQLLQPAGQQLQPHSQQQTPQQQHRAVMAHWDKRNPRAPTAVV